LIEIGVLLGGTAGGFLTAIFNGVEFVDELEVDELEIDVLADHGLLIST
jgi:hypothetical protein